MKKLLTVLGSVGLVATASISAVSCGTKKTDVNVAKFVEDVNKTMPSENNQGSTLILAIGAKNNIETQFFKKSIALYMGQSVQVSDGWAGIDNAYRLAQGQINNEQNNVNFNWLNDTIATPNSKQNVLDSFKIQNDVIQLENNSDDSFHNIFETNKLNTSTDQIKPLNGFDTKNYSEQKVEGAFEFNRTTAIEKTEKVSLDLIELNDGNDFGTSAIMKFITNTYLTNNLVKQYLNYGTNFSDIIGSINGIGDKESKKDYMTRIINKTKEKFQTGLDNLTKNLTTGPGLFLTIRNGQIVRISHGINNGSLTSSFLLNDDDASSKTSNVVPTMINNWLINEILNNKNTGVDYSKYNTHFLLGLTDCGNIFNLSGNKTDDIYSKANSYTSESTWNYKDWSDNRIATNIQYTYKTTKY